VSGDDGRVEFDVRGRGGQQGGEEEAEH
jgi:hypothetical protein